MNKFTHRIIGPILVTLILLSPTLVSFSPPPPGSQSLGVQSMTAPRVVLVADPVNSFFYVPAPPAGQLRIQSATITVNYLTTGSCSTWDPSAQAAFQYAVDIWASLVTSPVPIEIDACWEPLAPLVLGSAGTTMIYRDWSGVPVANRWYPAALADALSGVDNDPSTAEIEASFNSNFANWYFGTDGNTPAGKYDFATVVLHEVGHGLGFFGLMEVIGGQGYWDYYYGYPGIYDHFTENGADTALISYPSPSADLAAQLQSNNVYFDGTYATAANGGTPVKLYAPATWTGGSSYSHLDEIYNGTPNALMTWSLNMAESIHSPGEIMLNMFKDMGWTVSLNPDLSIVKQIVGGGDIDPGDPVTITLSVENIGAAEATNVVVTDTLSSDILSPSWQSSLPGTSVKSGTYVWDLPDLDVGDSGVITVTGTVNAALPPDFAIVNWAYISASETELSSSNNSSSALIGGSRVYLSIVFKDY
jgi:hypothetical protein